MSKDRDSSFFFRHRLQKPVTLLRIFFLTILCAVFISCGSESPLQIDLKDTFYWKKASEDTNLEEAAIDVHTFQKLEGHGTRRFEKLVGTQGQYLWLRSDFIVPEKLNGKNLGLYISYLRFADEVYLNGKFVGKNGNFPPDEKNTMFSAHFYGLPQEFLNLQGNNTILIKLWNHGRCGISDEVYISEYDEAKNAANARNYSNGKLYIIFLGGMSSASMIFIMIYLRRKKESENLYFALLNMASLFFITTFFAPEIPWYQTIPYLQFMKISLCYSFYLISFFTCGFIIHFLKDDQHKILRIIRHSILYICFAVTLFVPDYDWLIKVFPFMLALCFVQFAIGAYYILKNCILRQKMNLCVILIIGITPVLLSICADGIVRGIFHIEKYPFFTMFGWQLSIICFLMTLSDRYTKAATNSEYLTQKLEQEVINKTRSLSIANENLEREMKRAEVDLEMAAIVQQKFFPYPSRSFRGWDIAVCYSPAAKVSGDLYDYYAEDDSLKGLSLFDVSGHGISSGLITMLSKNIIFHSFKKSTEENTSVSQALYQINDEIIDTKGDIENYLTGIMLRVNEFDQDGKCRLEMANAGHPNPLLYSSETNKFVSLDHSEDESHFGAIGIKDIAVSFPAVEFETKIDDVLICFTDGLTEAMDKDHNQFGLDRVKGIIARNSEKDAQSILEELIDGLYDFTNGATKEDDLTIIVLKRIDPSAYIEELF